MKHHMFMILLILGLCPAFAAPAASRVLTLAQAKQIALENSPDLAAARERVAQAQEAVAGANADYLPTLALTSSWDHGGTNSQDSDQYSASLSATQVLFQGFYRKYNALAAEYTREMTLAEQADARRVLVWSVAQSFLNAQEAMEEIKITQSDMAFNREQEKAARAKEKQGTGSYSDVLNFKTKVNDARSSLIQAEQAYKEACCGLAALMGYEDARLPQGFEIQPLEQTAGDAGAATAPDPADGISTDARPDLEATAMAVEEARARLQREKSGYFPTLSLVGSYGAEGVEEFDGLGRDENLDASIGVAVSFELFSGGATRAAVRGAAAEARALANDLKAAKITAAKEIRTARGNVEAAGQTLALQQENTRLIRTARDLVKKEYEVGQASLVRLNEAQNDLVAAQGNLAEARVSLVLALEELAYYTGRNI